MNIDVARHTVREAFRVARELQDVMAFLKERCSADEYRQYATDIATALDAINAALLNRAIKAHPGLEREVEHQISIYGRYL
jgi:hypothetical protein